MHEVSVHAQLAVIPNEVRNLNPKARFLVLSDSSE
jgi:hypothetical protein